jgi:GNAT superfamily N-acetyltransferase
MDKGKRKKAHAFPATEGIEVFNSETLDEETRSEILDLLEGAYADSLLMIYVTDGRMGKILRTYQEMTLDLILDACGWITAVRSDSGEIAGVAFWLPPDVEFSIMKALSFMPVILKSFGLKCFVMAVWLFIMIEIAANMAKRTFNKRPRIYLADLAVKKSQQRKGYAGKLFEPVIRFADDNGYVLYLEADGEKNARKVYPKFGFVQLRKIWLKYYFSMARYPKPQ